MYRERERDITSILHVNNIVFVFCLAWLPFDRLAIVCCIIS